MSALAPPMENATVSIRASSDDLELDYSLTLPVKGHSLGSFSLLVEDLAKAIASGVALDMRKDLDTRRFMVDVERRNQLRKEQHEFYSDVRDSFERLSVAAQLMKRDYYREIDQLRSQLQNKKRSPEFHVEDIVFFDPTGYKIPTWDTIADELEKRRVKQEREADDKGEDRVRRVPVYMPCKICKGKMTASDGLQQHELPVHVSTQTCEAVFGAAFYSDLESRRDGGVGSTSVSRWAQTDPPVNGASESTSQHVQTACVEVAHDVGVCANAPSAASRASVSSVAVQVDIGSSVAIQVDTGRSHGNTLGANAEVAGVPNGKALNRRLKGTRHTNSDDSTVEVAILSSSADSEMLSLGNSGQFDDSCCECDNSAIGEDNEDEQGESFITECALNAGRSAAAWGAPEETASEVSQAEQPASETSQVLKRLKRHPALDRAEQASTNELRHAFRGLKSNAVGKGMSVAQRKQLAAKMVERRMAALQAHLQRVAFARMRGKGEKQDISEDASGQMGQHQPQQHPKPQPQRRQREHLQEQKYDNQQHEGQEQDQHHHDQAYHQEQREQQWQDKTHDEHGQHQLQHKQLLQKQRHSVPQISFGQVELLQPANTAGATSLAITSPAVSPPVSHRSSPRPPFTHVTPSPSPPPARRSHEEGRPRAASVPMVAFTDPLGVPCGRAVENDLAVARVANNRSVRLPAGWAQAATSRNSDSEQGFAAKGGISLAGDRMQKDAVHFERHLPKIQNGTSSTRTPSPPKLPSLLSSSQRSADRWQGRAVVHEHAK